MNDIAIDKEHLHYLEQLSEMYPTIGKASSEIINLQAILNLPKGTEHFVSDVHGEYEAFSHVLKNGSGAVRKKIDDVFGLAMNKADKAALATLIYYPREKMELIKQDEPDMDSWYKTTLYKLIEVCKTVSSKYTRSKVRKALPEEYAYVIEELITEKPEEIAGMIMEDLDRGATGINVKGMYSGQDKLMLFVVVNKKEIVMLKEKVDEIDPQAFVIVTDAREVHGEGFIEKNR